MQRHACNSSLVFEDMLERLLLARQAITFSPPKLQEQRRFSQGGEDEDEEADTEGHDRADIEQVLLRIVALID